MARKVFIPMFCLLAWTAKEVGSQCSEAGKRKVAGAPVKREREREREEITNIFLQSIASRPGNVRNTRRNLID